MAVMAMDTGHPPPPRPGRHLYGLGQDDGQPHAGHQALRRAARKGRLLPLYPRGHGLGGPGASRGLLDARRAAGEAVGDAVHGPEEARPLTATAGL